MLIVLFSMDWMDGFRQNNTVLVRDMANLTAWRTSYDMISLEWDRQMIKFFIVEPIFSKL